MTPKHLEIQPHRVTVYLHLSDPDWNVSLGQQQLIIDYTATATGPEDGFEIVLNGAQLVGLGYCPEASHLRDELARHSDLCERLSDYHELLRGAEYIEVALDAYDKQEVPE